MPINWTASLRLGMLLYELKVQAQASIVVYVSKRWSAERELQSILFYFEVIFLHKFSNRGFFLVSFEEFHRHYAER